MKCGRDGLVQHAKKQKTCNEKDTQVIETHVPLHILEIDDKFNLSKEQYIDWPCLVNKTLANNALATFRDNISCDSLRELPCAICSGLFLCEHLTTVAVQEIYLPLLKTNEYLKSPFFENDFVYGHPYIDRSGYKVLLDRNGFVKKNMINDKNLFDLQVCKSCKRSLDTENTPILLLANMWTGTTPQCLQVLTILEQLLISAGYICINLIQLTNRKYIYHKLKGHVITFTQNPASLSMVLPLPAYQLYDYLKVIFVKQEKLLQEQLRKILCIGGHEDNFCKQHISFKQYAKHLLHLSDPKFRFHCSFIFAVFDILRKREIAFGAHLITKQANFEQLAKLILKLTINNIKIAIKQEQNKQPIMNKAVLELLKNINLVDLHSPIVMMYTGKEIDINNLVPESFSTAKERARLAHLDLTAVAKYFDIMIEKIIKYILAYKKPEGGVLGEIKNYYEVVEYQDYGTPYCYILIWLQGTLNSIELQNRLKFKDFRDWLMVYINENIKKNISYLFPDEENAFIDFSYSKPTISDFEKKFRLDILRIAKHILFHRYTKSSSCCGNNDIKFIATTKLALAYIHYITDYITKSDTNIYNSFLMYAVTLNNFIAKVSNSNEYVSRSQKLVTICLNKIVGQSKITSPQVLAYLLGFKDHYTLNKFVMIYLDSFETYLTSQYPIKNLSELTLLEDSDTDSEDELVQDDNEHDLTNNEMFTIINSGRQINATTVYELITEYNSWHEACDAFLQDPNLSARLQFIINNIELLHRCIEEMILDCQLRQMAYKNPEITKIQRIEQFITGYDNTGDANILIFNDQSNFNTDNLTLLSPYNIIHSGLHNTNFAEILYYNQDEQTRFSSIHDDQLIKTWQEITTLRKRIEQVNNINSENCHLAKFLPHPSYQRPTNLLQEISINLNDEQKKAFLLICNHREKNYSNNPNKPPQLLMYLGDAGGTEKSKVIEAITKYFD
ncbi:24139_t:CDS:2 [Cetraspora pellucida]|uniref:24139_t:CDS:1 n=1 Tax=Cetraspora pellucida TaxID=1433469 RepID=A0A9N9C6H3_9GLOM|nr:24139_t:CDS:2 [Cetraspora pellucida]